MKKVIITIVLVLICASLGFVGIKYAGEKENNPINNGSSIELSSSSEISNENSSLINNYSSKKDEYSSSRVIQNENSSLINNSNGDEINEAIYPDKDRLWRIIVDNYKTNYAYQLLQNNKEYYYQVDKYGIIKYNYATNEFKDIIKEEHMERSVFDSVNKKIYYIVKTDDTSYILKSYNMSNSNIITIKTINKNGIFIKDSTEYSYLDNKKLISYNFSTNKEKIISQEVINETHPVSCCGTTMNTEIIFYDTKEGIYSYDGKNTKLIYSYKEILKSNNIDNIGFSINCDDDFNSNKKSLRISVNYVAFEAIDFNGNILATTNVEEYLKSVNCSIYK